MARPKILTLTLQTPSITNVMADQTATGAATLTLDGSLTSSGTLSLPTAQKIDFESAANLSATTLTISGTTELGAVVTETIAAPNANTVTSAKYWKTISSVTSTGALGTNMSAGVSDEAITAPIPLNRYNRLGTSIGMDIGGTINYTVEETMTPPQSGNTSSWINVSALASKTGDLKGTILSPVEAFRVTVNSYSSGATITANVSQS